MTLLPSKEAIARLSKESVTEYNLFEEYLVVQSLDLISQAHEIPLESIKSLAKRNSWLIRSEIYEARKQISLRKQKKEDDCSQLERSVRIESQLDPLIDKCLSCLAEIIEKTEVDDLTLKDFNNLTKSLSLIFDMRTKIRLENREF
jgi:hypothetical protein